jgi:tripartite-type tricarboxylate transporter receptor subunit TctC
MKNDNSSSKISRRKFVTYSGTVGIIGLTGCLSVSNGADSNNRTGNNGGSYPEKNIQVIVPWSQGGGTDRATRATTPTWSETFGANFVVQNYPGGSTQVGGERLYNAEPDGYTIAMWNMPQMQATWMFQDAPYGMDDFDYIGTHHLDPTMWFAPPESPYEDMSEFIEYARDQEQVTVGTTAAIGNTALSALLVEDTYDDINFNLVNLGGGTPVRQATLSGDVDASVNQPWAFNPDNVSEVLGLGTHTPETQELWPAPSFGELGLNDIPLVDEGFGQWKLIVAPGGLKNEYPERYNALADSYADVFEQDEFRSLAKEQGGLNQILEYNNPEKTEEEVQAYSNFMQEYEPLFDRF